MTSLWLPFFSGILLALTLPAFGIWPLVWVALVPFFLFASNKHISFRRLCAGVALFALPYSIAAAYPLMRVTSWWWSSGIESLGMPELELRFAFFIVLLGLWGAFFFLPLAYILRRFGAHPATPIVVAFAWVMVEWARSSFALIGYSWGVLGYTLLDTTYLKYAATVGGVYALSFLIVLGNMSLVEIVRLPLSSHGGFLKRTRSVLCLLIDQPRMYCGIWFFIGCFALAFSLGIYREQQVLTTRTTCAATPLRAAVVSADILTDESIGGWAYRTYRTKIEVAIAGGATLIVLPENTFPFFELNESDNSLNTHNIIRLREQEELYADFLSLSQMHPEVIIAVGLHTNDGSLRHNSLVIFQHGEPTQYYHKRKLVPFAEYAPLGFSTPLVMPFNAGTREQFLLIDGVKTTGLMCSEVSDATIPMGGVDMILAPSNDSVFVSDAAGRVAHHMARMRALEAGAYLLRASKGGISSIIEPNGNVLVSGHDGVLIADVCPERAK